MSALRLPNNWTPRAYQLPLWGYLEHGGTLAYVIAHRRWGKDDIALHRTACAAFERVGNYWHMLPQGEQARKAVWDAVNPHTGLRRIDEAFPEELCATRRDDEMFIRFANGSTWQVIGSDNYNRLVGSPPVGVVFSEWALAKPQAWGYLRPILTENGGWALFITTPRGTNHAAKMYEALKDDPKAFVQKSPATETDVFTPAQLEAERASYVAEYGPSTGEALYAQEYLCDFDAAVVGAIYARDLKIAKEQGRIGRFPWIPSKLVYTSWDLGRRDSTAIWFWQYVDGRPRFIDYFEDKGEVITYYLAQLKAKGYQYDTLVFPHDAENEHVATDATVASIVRANGFRVQIAPKVSIEDGINAARLMIAKSDFDEKCQPGLDALQAYQWDYNQRLEELKPTPLHNWASHGADAFRYAAVSGRGESVKRKPIKYDNRGIV